jgi:hypothetical protein
MKPKWIAIAIIAVLVIGGASYWFGTQRGGTTTGVSQPGAGSSGGSTVGQITIPADLSATGETHKVTIKLASDWPSELAAVFEKPELGELGQVMLKGTITNTSSQTVNFTEIVYSLDGQGENNISGLPPIGGFNLVPGEDMAVETGFMPFTAKTVTIKILGFNVLAASEPASVTPTPTTPEPTTPTPTPGEWPIKETWTVQTPSGPVVINYRETDWAAQNIKFFKEGDKFYIENRTGQAIVGLIQFGRFTLKDGQIVTEEFELNTLETGRTEIDDINKDIDPKVNSGDLWYDFQR